MAAVAKTESAPTNARGIPYAPFVDRVEDYVSDRSQVDTTVNSFKEMISKYQFMQQNTQRRATGLKDKIPDIRKTLETVRFLSQQSSAAAATDDDPSAAAAAAAAAPLTTTFSLNTTLYAKAIVPPTSTVYLWLGANVMLSYPVDEAEALLSAKLATARESLRTCEEDAEFLREQITTLEVAFARVYNWDVAMRRKEREEKEGGKEGEGEG